MGNRAVLTTRNHPDAVAIYLHWNGGPESIKAFLKVARDLNVRDPLTDEAYGMARLCQIIANYFGGVLSIGIGRLERLDTDNGNNGTYVLGPDFTIAEHLYAGDHDADLNTDVYDAALKANQKLFQQS